MFLSYLKSNISHLILGVPRYLASRAYARRSSSEGGLSAISFLLLDTFRWRETLEVTKGCRLNPSYSIAFGKGVPNAWTLNQVQRDNKK
jgi:hypothetical protein